MRAMFASAVDGPQLLDTIERAAGFGSLDAIQSVAAFAAVDDDVQTVKSPQQSLGAADVRGKFLDLGVGCFAADGRGRNREKAGASLIGDDQPVLVIDAHADP